MTSQEIAKVIMICCLGTTDACFLNITVCVCIGRLTLPSLEAKNKMPQFMSNSDKMPIVTFTLLLVNTQVRRMILLMRMLD